MDARLWTVVLILPTCVSPCEAQRKPPPAPPDQLPPSLELGKGDRVIARHASGVACVKYSPDGKLLATAGGDLTIRLWDLETGKEVRRFEGHKGFIRTVAFSPDGKLLASAGESPSVILWDVATGKEVRRIGKHLKDLRMAVFSPNGKTILASDFDEKIGLWDVATGKQIHLFRAHPRVPYGIAFSPDGKTIASGGDNEGTIRLWDVASGRELRHWDGHPKCVYTVAYSPDGRLLASGGDDGTARLWEVATSKEVHRLEGHKNGVTKLAFAPDGRTLVTASHDDTVHLWETRTGQEIRRFGKHKGWVWGVAYSPTGRSVASAGHDTTAVVWDLGPVAVSPERKPLELTAGELEGKWRELADANAGKAFQAALTLSAVAPKKVVPFLQERLRPARATPIDNARLERLIRELDDDDFTVRENADKELQGLGESAGPALRKALANPGSLEARRRLEVLVERLNGRELAPERLQALRALRVLEDLNTEQTRELLRQLAGGEKDDPLTREAEAVLVRLTKQTPPKP